jgi:LPXTG-motif cell wall-anchored protein
MQTFATPSTLTGLAGGQRTPRCGHFPFPFTGVPTGAEAMELLNNWYVIIGMLVAVIGLIVLLMYLRKKEKDS